MTEDIERRALLADLAGRHQALGLDELRLIERVTAAVERLARDPEGRGRLRGADERLTEALLDVAAEIAGEDQQQGEARERARAEMVGRPAYPIEPAGTTVIAVNAISIMDAPPDLKAKALDQLERECRRLTTESEIDDRPHINSDLASIGPLMTAEEAEAIHEEWALDASDADQPIGVMLPDWDFEGGAG